MKQLSIAGIILFSLLLLGSCSDNKNKKIQFSGEAQGTYYAITYFAYDTVVTQFQIDSILTAFDQSASIWVKNSVISQINNNKPEAKPDENFTAIFKQAKRIWKETDGSFDITVGPLVNAWGFGFKNKIPVNDEIIDSLLQLVNFRGVRLENGKIVKDNPNIQIDFNAIAQGYSVDLLAGYFIEKGIQNFLIDVGGEVYGKGNKPGNQLWVVGIEKPAETAIDARKLNATIEIKNQAIATSGNYRKYYEENGIKYSHTIDPKTGYPAKQSLLSATVMADSTSIADAYATALMVMGLEKSKKFLQKTPEIEAYLIYSLEDGTYETWATEKMHSLIKEK